jgi:CheY-like chemotaxis protein
MANQSRDFVIRYLREALVGAIAEADGNETLSRRLHARAKLRLITMSDEELQELVKLVACPPERPVEMVYQGLKDEIADLKQTAMEWMKDLQRNATPNPEEEIHDRILIVENEPSLREELVSVFKQAGFAVSDASDYSQALQRLYEFKVSLIIMESLLPDWDGFDASYEFRNRFGIPVILLGQDSSDQVWEKVMGANAEHYEIKPCKCQALVARAKVILRRYKSNTSKSRSSNDLYLEMSSGQDGLKCSFLSPQDIEDGFSIATDDRKNITLLKQGNQVAWFSAAVSEEAVKVFIRLIRACE